jgi:hypothetical protein
VGESIRFAAAFARHRPDAAAWLDAEAAAAGVGVAAPARDGLLAWLDQRLVACAATALDAERRRLAPTPAPEAFAESLAGDAAWRGFLAGYPVVARLVESSLATWRRRVANLVGHVARDQGALGAGPALERVHVHGALLQAGRTTLGVELAGGARWMYRDQDLPMAAWFMALCAELNRAGLSAPLHVRRILLRDGCSWDELVVAAPCPPAEVRSYFVRAGLLLGLLERLDACDFHVENVIGAGPYPVLIDIETLFHPWPARMTAAARAYWGSALRTGLVDAVFYGELGKAAVYAGGLHPGGRLVMPFRSRRLRRLDDAEGGAEEFHEVVDVAPTLPAPLGDHLDDLLAGYREMDELELPLAGVGALPVRHVRTEGMTYERLLTDSLQPGLLCSEAARDAWLARTGLAPVELAALRDLMVPRPATTSAGWQPGPRADRALRLDLLETAATLLDDRPAPRRPSPPPPSPTAAAIAIGDAIVAAGFPGPEWLGVVARPWAGVRVVNLLPADLLSGQAGLALVLAQLHAVTRLERFRDAALTVLAAFPPGPAPPGFLGAHLGFGGTIYALARCAGLVGAPALATRARLYLERLPRARLAAGPWDVVTGLAGLVLAALAAGDPPREAVAALAAAWERGLGEAPIVPGALPAFLPDVATGVAHVLGRAGAPVPLPPDGHALWRLGLDPDAPAAAARVVDDPGADPLDALELALTAHEVTGDARFAAAARERAAALVERRRASGRWFPGTRVAERLDLSALTGVAAIAHAFLRLESPGLCGSIRRLD